MASTRRRPEATPGADRAVTARGAVVSALLLAGAVSCGSPPVLVAPSIREAPAPDTLPAASPVTAHARPAPAPPSAHVEPTGCRFAGPTTDPIAVSFDGRRPDATFGIARSPADVELVLGQSASASSVTFDVFGLRLDAQVPENGVGLHARAPLALAGVYDPDEWTPLRWSVRQGLVVRVEAGKVVARVPLEKEVACGDVGLGVVKTPPRPLPKVAYLARGASRLLLSAQPGEAPAVELPADAVVSVHGTKRDQAEISYEEDGVWHGWTPTKALVRVKEAPVVGYGVGSGRMRTERFPGVTCPEALPLYVRKSGAASALARVGTVRARAHVALAEPTEEPLRALLAEQRADTTAKGELRLREGFELAVDRDASRACVSEAVSAPVR